MTDAAAPVSGAGFFESTRADLAKTFVSRPPVAVQQCAPQTAEQWRATHKADIEQAIAAQRQMLLDRKADIARWDDKAKGDFYLAFGDDTPEQTAMISARIDRELALNSTLTVDNFSPPTTSNPNNFAYVHAADASHTIFLDQKFWDAPLSGANSKAGTLCHEMSHFNDIGATEDSFPDYNHNDPVYGPTNSMMLATYHPALALQHADSFEYYCEGESLFDGS